MKRNYIVRLFLLFIPLITVTACRNGKKEAGGEMHAGHIKSAETDTGLNYLLKPVNEQVVSTIPVIRANKGTSIYLREVPGRVTYDMRSRVSLASRVSGRIEKLYIKYNYQPVKKGQLIMEIYSPDLAAAQREFLMIRESGNRDGMLEAARQRLMLLGMDQQQISRLLRTGQVSYSIPVYSNASGYILEKQLAENAAGTSSDASSSILLREGQYLDAGQNIFTIYRSGDLLAEFSLTPDIAAQVDRQSKVLIQRTADKEETVTGRIGLIQPVLNAGESFVIARVYLRNSSLLPGELVTGHIPFLSGNNYWLPEEAVISIGNRSVVFKKEGRVFIPRTIKPGISQNKQVQVPGEISEWDLAANAYYLIDSESFIKTPKGEIQ